MQVMWTANPLGKLYCISVPTRRLAISLAAVTALLIVAGIVASVVAFKLAFDYNPGLITRIGGVLTLSEAEKRDSAYRSKLQELHEEITAAEQQLGQLQALKEQFATMAMPRAARPATTPRNSKPGQGGPHVSLQGDDGDGVAGTDRSMTASGDFGAARARLEKLSRRVKQTDSDWRKELSKLEYMPTSRPVADMQFLSSTYGVRVDPFTQLPARHEGIDISAPAGTPILATASGVVARVATDPQYGRMVDIDHGNGYLTRYAHARAIYVKPKQRVQRGAAIGAVGSTGRSTGPHLHYEVRLNNKPENPLDYGLRRQ